jgi:hypothetical protein
LYHHISQDNSNDQHGLDDILNDPKLLKDVMLVGKLPRCLSRTKDSKSHCPSRNLNIPRNQSFPDSSDIHRKFEDQSILKLRILDGWQFMTGAFDDSKPWARKWVETANEEFYTGNNLKGVPLRVPVSFHGNWWDRDKQSTFQDSGLWYLNDQGQCLLS